MEAHSVIEKVASVEELKTLRKSEPLLGVYFFENSGTCHKLAPGLEKLATDKQYSDVKLVRVDMVACDEDVREKYQVNTVPSFMFFKNDGRVDHIEGDDMRAVRSALEKLTKRVRRITTLIEFDTLKTVHERLIVHFFAEWAVECERLAVALEDLASAGGEGDDEATVKFARIDINECETLAREFRVLTVPTFVCIRNGVVIDQFVGPPSERDDGKHGFASAIALLNRDFAPPNADVPP